MGEPDCGGEDNEEDGSGERDRLRLEDDAPLCLLEEDALRVLAIGINGRALGGQQLERKSA